MRRTWLASAAVAAAAISVPVTAVIPAAQAAPLSGQQKAIRAAKAITRASVTWNAVAATLARRLVGLPYVYGGTTTAGFDCSGLTQFVYLHAGHGKRIERTAQEQFLQFRMISHASARPGDLVFFHETSDPYSLVYHVGVYEGGDDMVAATTYGEGVQLQSFTWGGDTVTFGTIRLSPGAPPGPPGCASARHWPLHCCGKRWPLGRGAPGIPSCAPLPRASGGWPLSSTTRPAVPEAASAR
jgi:cell wall-associated NlpC family hydrolase